MAELLRFFRSQLFLTPPKPTTTFDKKTVIVTGSNTGLGLEAARHFTALNASRVILAVRSIEKGEAAKRDIEKTTGRQDVVKVMHLDMSSYESVLDFAKKASEELDRIDIAVLNAGVMRSHWEMFEQDESTMTVNVVSTFLLALALLPKLVDTSKAFNTRPTMTVVSSEMHAWASFKERNAPEGQIFATLNTPPAKGKSFDPSERYSLTKLMEVFGVRELCSKTSLPVTINCMNPGFCHSEFGRESGVGVAIMRFFLARSTEVGARTLVHAGGSGEESNGQYLSDCEVTQPNKNVLSEDGKRTQERVWKELTAKLEGIRKGITQV